MAWLWIGLAACSGEGEGDAATPPGDPCLPGPSPTLEIGTGDQGYLPMPDPLEVVHGPQGGYHVVLAFEATYLDASAVVAGAVTGTLGGEVVATSQPYLELRCDPDTQTLVAWGTLLIYSNGNIAAGDLSPEELDGEPTTIVATLTDSAGAAASGSADTTLFDPLVE